MGVVISVCPIWPTPPLFVPDALHFSFHPELCMLRPHGVIGKWEVKLSTGRNERMDRTLLFLFLTTTRQIVHGLQLTFWL